MNTIQKLIDSLGETKTFIGEPVDNDAVMAIFNAARIAPSADNVQMWRFVVVTDQGERDILIGSIPSPKRDLFNSAPLLVAAMADPWFVKGSRKEQPFFMIDVPIALTHVVMMAAELGLACIVEYEIDEESVRNAVEASKEHRAVAVIAIGKPA